MQHKTFDKAGIWVAILCAIHCLLVPVILPTLSLMGLAFMGLFWVEMLVLSLSAIIGGSAVVMGLKHHGSFIPLLMLIAGIALFIAKHDLHAPWEQIVIVIASSLLIGAHSLNLYLCRAKNHVPCEEVDEQQAVEHAVESPAKVSS
ncbi:MULTISPECIES: MerC domain-containing protein [Gammaproteobacteria]|uniref:MerC domain-containing protein n=1 Tax=Gammaproteobacteria TaxID=1236 RepID=UPI000DCFC3CF|nr:MULTISPECIES: MerC domain-containing protein [Gammaproteobacteria]RTE85678.1 MerC domain-containing protein [Aliidiomarina sp. B3213]TCZ90319.1 MerC domain-containing protein [Lysobacter sp. N42]